MTIAVAVTVVSTVVLRGHLPSPVAVHWGPSGAPNGSASLLAAIATPMLVAVVLSLATWRAPRPVQRALNAFTSALLVLTVALVIWANWDRANWQDAAHLRSPALAAMIVMPIAAALAVVRQAGRRAEGEPARPRVMRAVNWGAGIAAALLGMFALVRVAGPAVGPMLPLVLILVVFMRAKRPASFRLVADDDTLTLELNGVDALLCARRRIVVPLDAVRGIAVDDRSRIPRPGMRIPGTGIPGVITAGSYGFQAERSFWDVRKSSTLIRIELDPSMCEYCRLVLEVPSPQEFAHEWRGRLGAWVPAMP